MYSVSKTKDIVLKLGPNKGGWTWDEKGSHEVVQIFVWHDNFLNSIQFLYAKNGSFVLSRKHGSCTECEFDAVKLNYPYEYITWISGCQTPADVHSVKIGTNCGEYGPFGSSTVKGNRFIYRLGERQFNGFHGVLSGLGSMIQSIGVYLKPNTTPTSVKDEENVNHLTNKRKLGDV